MNNRLFAFEFHQVVPRFLMKINPNICVSLPLLQKYKNVLVSKIAHLKFLSVY